MDMNEKRMREIEVFGVPALMTFRSVPHDAVYPGMFRYELQAGDNVPYLARFLVDRADTGFLGTVLTPVSMEVPDHGRRKIEQGDLVLGTDDAYLTPAEFEEKYLSPQDEEFNTERKM